MKKRFKKTVLEHLEKIKNQKAGILTGDDIMHLPSIVQKYLTVTGAVGKEKILNFRTEFEGGIRSRPGEKFMKLKSVQYNFTGNPSRLFYIEAKKMGIPAKGIHIYEERKAIMLIKLFGLFTISDAKGTEMDQGETVTLFNDMCFIAPGTLIDSNIEWNKIDSTTAGARFTNGDITISATLYFNEKGELIDFLSNERFETTDGKTFNNYPWKTPVTGYKDFNGYHLPSGAKLIYTHPEGDFCYGEFNLVNTEFNCMEYK